MTNKRVPRHEGIAVTVGVLPVSASKMPVMVSVTPVSARRMPVTLTLTGVIANRMLVIVSLTGVTLTITSIQLYCFLLTKITTV